MNYREPGREVDHTEIARTEVRERGETERKKIEEREITRRAEIAYRSTAGYIATRISFAVALVLLGLVGWGAFGHWLEARHPSPPRPPEGCKDVQLNKSSLQHECPHTDHTMTEEKEWWMCRCRRREQVPAPAQAVP